MSRWPRSGHHMQRTSLNETRQLSPYADLQEPIHIVSKVGLKERLLVSLKEPTTHMPRIASSSTEERSIFIQMAFYVYFRFLHRTLHSWTLILADDN